jgi:voltage-gated potassium channel Kch
VIAWVVLLIWGGKFIFTPVSGEAFSQSYMHLVNLPFHEAGHVIFSPFGRFIQVLGGTLGQWLVPFAVTVSFLLRSDRFAASVGLWWLGQSFMDIASYMDDARAGQLMLLGGVTGSEVEDFHDWEIILIRLGLMKYDHVIARVTFGCGVVMILVALAWGGWVLNCKYRARRS